MANETVVECSSRKKRAKNAQKGVRHFLRSKKHSSLEVDSIIMMYNLEVLKKKDASKKLIYMIISEDFNLFKKWYNSQNFQF